LSTLQAGAGPAGSVRGSPAIEGNACSIATNEYNQGLSKRRAEAGSRSSSSMVYLRADVDQGYGEEKPAHENSTREGRRLNRRVDIAVVEGDEKRLAAVPSTSPRARPTTVPAFALVNWAACVERRDHRISAKNPGHSRIGTWSPRASARLCEMQRDDKPLPMTVPIV
jgi:hypothetical protein